MGLEKINQIRKELGISVEELSKKSGVPMGTLSKITAGITTNPNLSTVRAISDALGCTLDDFADKDLTHTPAATDAGAGTESRLLSNFHSLNEEGQEKLVDLSEDLVSSGRYKKADTVRVFRAARSSDNTPPGYVDMPAARLQKLRDAPESDDDL